MCFSLGFAPYEKGLSCIFIFTEYKRARQEIKKKSSDTLKLQKKAKKGKHISNDITSCGISLSGRCTQNVT